jgi:hypothetical protein
MTLKDDLYKYLKPGFKATTKTTNEDVIYIRGEDNMYRAHNAPEGRILKPVEVLLAHAKGYFIEASEEEVANERSIQDGSSGTSIIDSALDELTKMLDDI